VPSTYVELASVPMVIVPPGLGRGPFTTTFVGAGEPRVVVGTTRFHHVVDTVGILGPD
jgi:hypothetical protein